MNQTNFSQASYPTVFFDGKYLHKQEAMVPFGERTLLFGDGLFTTIAVRSGKIEGWHLHMARLQAQFQVLDVNFTPLDSSIPQQLIALNAATEGLIKLKVVVTREPPHVYMELSSYQFSPGCLLVGLFPEPVHSPLCRLKSISYLERLFFKEWAARNGLDDVILTSADGFMTEASSSAIFWVKNHIFYFPESSLPKLDSIALKVLVEVAKRVGMEVRPTCSRGCEIDQEARFYLSNAMMPVRAVESIDGRKLNQAPHEAESLREAYLRYVL